MRQTLGATLFIAGAALSLANVAVAQPVSDGGLSLQTFESFDFFITAGPPGIVEPSTIDLQTCDRAAFSSELAQRNTERWRSSAQLVAQSYMDQLNSNTTGQGVASAARDYRSELWFKHGGYIDQAIENDILRADDIYMEAYRDIQADPSRMAQKFPGAASDYSGLTTALVQKIAQDYELAHRPGQIILPSKISLSEKERLGAMTVQAALIYAKLSRQSRSVESREHALSLEERRDVFETQRQLRQLHEQFREAGCSDCIQFSPPVATPIFTPIEFPPPLGIFPEAPTENFPLTDALIATCQGSQQPQSCGDLANRSTIDNVMRLIHEGDSGFCSAVRIKRGVALTAGHCCPRPGDRLRIRLNSASQSPADFDFVINEVAFENPDPDGGLNAFVERCDAYRAGGPAEDLPRCLPADNGCAPLIPGYDLAAVFYEEAEELDLPPVKLLAEDPPIGAPMRLAGYGDNGFGSVGVLRADASTALRQCEGISSCVLAREFEVGGCGQIDSMKGDSGGLAAVQNKTFEHLLYGLVSRQRHHVNCEETDVAGPGGVYTRLTKSRVEQLSGAALDTARYSPPTSRRDTCDFLKQKYPEIFAGVIQIATEEELCSG